MGKKNLVICDSNEKAIDDLINEAQGKIENSLSYREIKMNLKTRFPLRLMRGAYMTLEANCCLPKAYRYSKEICVVSIRHNGKNWLFDKAYRSRCFAGGNRGGAFFSFPKSNENEIKIYLCVANAIAFYNCQQNNETIESGAGI
jgi:hypothetical protein